MRPRDDIWLRVQHVRYCWAGWFFFLCVDSEITKKKKKKEEEKERDVID